jgi:hypothetical protein
MIRELLFGLFHLKAYCKKETIKQKYYGLMFDITKKPIYYSRYQGECFK